MNSNYPTTGRTGVHTEPKYGTKPIRYVALQFRGRRGAASLPPKMCVRNVRSSLNRNPIQYGFRAGERSIFYSVNMAVVGCFRNDVGEGDGNDNVRTAISSD